MLWITTSAQYAEQDAINPKTMKLATRGKSLFHQLSRAFLTALMLLICSAASGQQARTRPTVSNQPASNGEKSSPLSIRVRTSASGQSLLTLRAENVPYPQVANELGRRFKAQVMLSDLLKKQRLTQEFEAVPLETALRMVAPLVYIDYEISGDPAVKPKILGIYLHAWNERPPPLNAIVRNHSESVIFSGDTEETGETGSSTKEGEALLQVNYEKQLLSVRTRKQPLSVILYEVASKLSVPFQGPDFVRETSDINFSQLSLDDAVRHLSPNVLLDVRSDLLTSERIPLRLIFKSTNKNQSSGEK